MNGLIWQLTGRNLTRMNGYYRSFDDEMRELFGGKVYRLSLSAAHTCPNRDGKCGTGGCIFCSAGGSGDFAENSESIDEQIERAKLRVSSKLGRSFAGYMAYFQSFTETYGDTDYLAGCFEQAVAHPEVLALSVATRPDSISDGMIARLKGINESKPVYVELGLQTMHEDTARYINRCYELSVFEDAFRRLKGAGLKVVVHVIIGLPNEDEERTAATVRYLAELKSGDKHIDGIKLQLLHVLKGTELAARLTYQEPALCEGSQSEQTGADDTALMSETGRTLKAHGDIYRKEAINAERLIFNKEDDKAERLSLIKKEDNQAERLVFNKEDNNDERLILNDGAFLTCYNMSSYAGLIVRLTAMLPECITVHRVTGDAPKSLLIWPQWTADKKRVLNTIAKAFRDKAAGCCKH